MLPILQALADDNDTIIRIVSISNFAGEKLTIITAYQLLHSRGKDLVLASPKCEDVIFLLGGLRVCINFLKASGQHMDTADWMTCGLNLMSAANTTDIILDGTPTTVVQGDTN